MTKPAAQPYCAYCTYRYAIAVLSVGTQETVNAEPVCFTCASEAISYYCRLGLPLPGLHVTP